MREMKDSGIEWIGKMPKDWGICRIAHHTNFVNGYAFQSGDLNNDNGCIVIRIGNVSPKGLNLDNALKYNGAITELLGYKIKNGDIVIAMSGATTGKNCLVRSCKEVLLINQRVGIVRANKDIRFISYILNCAGFSNYIDLLSAGSAQPNISGKSILSFQIPDPPIDIKERIADYLDSKCSKIDAIIEREQAVIEKLKEYKLSIITEAVTKGLNPDVEMKDSGIEWVGKIPDVWEIIKLKYCTYIRARLGWKGLKADEYVDDGFPLLSAFNIVNNKLVFMNLNYINADRYEESPEIKLRINDVLLVKDGAGIGKCAIVTDLPIPATVNGSIAVVTVDNNLLGYFLYYYFLSNIFQSFIGRLKDGMGVPHLFQSDLREIQIPLPDEREQEAIVNYLTVKCNRIDSAVERKQSVIDKLTEYKKSLIYEVVTGKKEV